MEVVRIMGVLTDDAFPLREHAQKLHTDAISNVAGDDAMRLDGAMYCRVTGIMDMWGKQHVRSRNAERHVLAASRNKIFHQWH
jgi:hypothetical protein